MTFKTDGTHSQMDVTDVVEMTETLRGQPRPEAFIIDEQGGAEASAGKGVFLHTKPRQDAAPVAEPKPSLRSRFASKRPATPDAVVEAQPAKPAAAEKPARAKWFSKKTTGESPSVAAPAPVDIPAAPTVDAPARAEGPVGPTKKVKTPIVVSRVVDKKKPAELPIRVLIGFLAEVSEREAREYAQGIADRNCQQISLVYFDAFKYGNGCAYEIHEGGSGRAYLPEIIKSFKESGTYRKDGEEDASVFIRTATRMVQVSRTPEGLQAFLLPENSTEEASPWLQGTTKMSPALPTLVAVLVAGATLFITGFLALSLAMVSRIQPFDAAAAPVIENVTEGFANSPLSRWAALQSVSGDEYVKAVRFANGKWEIQRGTAEAPPAPPAPPVPAPLDAATSMPAPVAPPATPAN
jgi:hypothetical protein